MPIIRSQETGDRSQEKKDKAFYVKALASNECACGKTKDRGKSFCYKCFRSLPTLNMRMSMYRHIGDGYEEAYEEAVKYLEVNVW